MDQLKMIQENVEYRIYIRQPDKPPIAIATPGGDLCSNYKSKAQSLLPATVTQLETKPNKSVLLTYSLSVLQSLASGNPEENTLHNLVQSINNLKSRTTYVLQWIPAHTGIHGNEVAISWRKREARSSSPNPTLVTEKQKRSSETRG